MDIAADLSFFIVRAVAGLSGPAIVGGYGGSLNS